MGHKEYILTVALYIASVQCYPYFQDRIPNGRAVPHPCKSSSMWYGVGHLAAQGGGQTNAFGAAFEANGYEWNECICRQDSDGDGRSNGEELGDPNCVWTVGQKPQIQTGITHPGICDPFFGAECAGKNSWVDCSQAEEFKCDAIDNPDTKILKINMDRHKVPNKETNYICQTFNVADRLPEGDSHIVAFTPDIVNADLVHHMIIYACYDDQVKTNNLTATSPMECGMEASVCPNMVALWSIGLNGDCLDERFGFRVGTNGFKTFLIEIHYNNPELLADQYDSSGMSLYLSTSLRENDGGVWAVFPLGLVIPPGYPQVEIEGGCNAECTSLMLDEPIFISVLMPHMHYLGTGFRFELYRDGKQIYQFTTKYNYDSPVGVRYDEPLEIRPGDQLKVYCTYQTMSKDQVTFYGEATSDEMCFGFFIYYPMKPKLTQCGAVDDNYGFCNDTQVPAGPVCDVDDLTRVVTQHWQSMMTSCDPNGKVCLDGCKEAIAPVKGHPCFQEKAEKLMTAYYVYSAEGKEVLKRFASCDERPANLPGESHTDQLKCDIPISAANTLVTVGLIGQFVVALIWSLFM